MITTYLVKGLILGFSIAAPVGPIGVLCIRRTLNHGMASGFASGFGTATADAIYGVIAAFGLTVISSFLLEQQTIIRLSGGIFLLYLGYTTFFSSPASHAANASEHSLFSSYTSSFFLTITNPMTIISFAAVFAGIGINSAGENTFSAAILVLGVFIGSLLWWLLLSGGISLFRNRVETRHLIWINRLSGLIILAFGTSSILSLL